MKKDTTVSLCLIAKNEEEHILSCLNSAKQLIDEIIVVDTGSEDQTAPLAREAGAKVFHFPWTGDFSQAKNFALEQAASDWILFLDADEVLDPVSRENFEQLLYRSDIEGYFLTIISYLGNGHEVISDRVVRLFRNKPIYRFQGAIHEQVAQSIMQANDGRGLTDAPLVIRHYGYLASELRKKNKTKRNTLIIERELKQNPRDPFLLYCLAVELYQQGDVQEGLNCLEKALHHLQGTEGYVEDVIHQMAVGLSHLRYWGQLISFINKALPAMPQQTELLLIRGLGFYHTGHYLAAAQDLEKVLQQGGSASLPLYHVLGVLGDAYNLAGHYAKAEKAYFSALGQSTRFLYPFTQLLGLVQGGRNTVSLAQFSRLISFKDNKFVWQELIKAGEIPLALIIILFAIHEVASGSGYEDILVQLSQEFTSILPRMKPLPARKESFEYLSVVAVEMDAYAATLARGYHLEPLPAKKLLGLVEKTILLLVTEFCPRWSPQLLGVELKE